MKPRDHLCVGSRRRNNPKDLRYRLFLGSKGASAESDGRKQVLRLTLDGNANQKGEQKVVSMKSLSTLPLARLMTGQDSIALFNLKSPAYAESKQHARTACWSVCLSVTAKSSRGETRERRAHLCGNRPQTCPQRGTSPILGSGQHQQATPSPRPLHRLRRNKDHD